MTTKTPSRRIEVFRSGTHTSSQGDTITFTTADLREISEAYDPVTAPAPVVVGHPEMDTPAYGWARAFPLDDAGELLQCDLDELAPTFVTAVQKGEYRKVSLALFGRTHPANPKPGKLYPRHVGFLGGAAPAVTKLQPVHFAAGTGEIIVIEFAAPAATAWSVKNLFQRLRDWMIDKHGLEGADQALPAYLVDSITPENDPMYTAPSPAPEPQPEPPAPTPEETAMSQPTIEQQLAEAKAQAAKAQADLEQLQANNAAAAITAARTDASQFCAGLVKDGKLVPADVPAVESLLVSLANAKPITFGAEGAQTTVAPVDTLKRVLGGAKAVMDFSTKTPAAELPTGEAPTFAAPVGATVDPEGAKLHAAAKKIQRANKDMSFADALAQATHQ